MDIRRVGVLMRDTLQEYPLDILRERFRGPDSRIYILNDGLPEEQLDLIIAMGGDGTVLKALDMLPNCPVLAVNYGTVGFLTAGDRDDLERLLDRLLAGDYVLSERILLRCDHPGGSAHVINEVVVRSSWRMINVEVAVNDCKIRTIRGDGVIVGTPTGTTGYLLSTQAPLVMPDAQCFVLDGINEYNFTSRAVILPASMHIHLRLEHVPEGQQAFLYIDGRPVREMAQQDEVFMRLSERRAQLIFFDEHYFFHNLSSRLSWN